MFVINENKVEEFSKYFILNIVSTDEELLNKFDFPEFKFIKILSRIRNLELKDLFKIIFISGFLFQKTISNEIGIEALNSYLNKILENIEILQNSDKIIQFTKEFLKIPVKIFENLENIIRKFFTNLDKLFTDFQSILNKGDARSLYDYFIQTGLIKDKTASLLVYTFSKITTLTNARLIVPHIDIHVIKILLRIGIIRPDYENLRKLIEGKYIMKILPINFELSSGKSIFSILKKLSIDAITKICDKIGITSILMTYYLSNLSKEKCLFNDDVNSSNNTCPIKNIDICPFQDICDTYYNKINIKIFSRRQLKNILKILKLPSREIEEHTVEVIVI